MNLVHEDFLRTFNNLFYSLLFVLNDQLKKQYVEILLAI